MKDFFKNRMDDLDEEDVYRYIKKYFDRDDYQQGGSSGGSSGGSGGSNNSYNQSKSDQCMRKLAHIHDMIEEFFELEGITPQAYLKEEGSFRRGVSGTGSSR